VRIAWFTPFHRASAIGRFSRLVTAELAKSVDVDIWHPASADLHPTALRTIDCPHHLALGPENLAAYDLCVYNLGDHLDFHREIFLTSRRVPGLVVLHDFVMHHFFAAYYLDDLRDGEAYEAAMARWYGEGGKRAAEEAVRGMAPGVWESDRVAEFPLFQEAVRGASGVIVHSEFLREAVAGAFEGPIRRLFLAYDRPQGALATKNKRDLLIPDDRLLVITVGHANPNKKIVETIQAIGRNEHLARAVVYVVLGPCDGPYGDEIRRTIAHFGLDRTVRVLGRVSDELLASYLTHADVCVNLRWPAMEGASASAIEEMLYSKPVIVTDGGFYRELPSQAVSRIQPGNEIDGLTETLCRLVTEPQLRKHMGEEARRFAAEHSAADRYAAGLLEFVDEVMDGIPILKLMDRMADRLSAMGVGIDQPMVRRVADEAYSMLCANGRVLRPLPE
jgi:glycosyltransferase involved in cell wall biosynthesis